MSKPASLGNEDAREPRGGAGEATDKSDSTDVAGAKPAKRGKGRHSKRSTWSNPWLIAVAVVAGLLVVSGIALAFAPDHNGTRSGDKSKKAAPVVATRPSALCPLTGSPAPGGRVPQRPALAIKVDNYPYARPQSGLNEADLVFEEPVEGGITRYVAVFQCHGAPLVGPVRSARYPDVGILDQLSKPIFIHDGGIDPILAMLNEGNLFNDDLFSHAAIVQLLPTRSAPYNTYVSTAAGWGLQPQDTSPPSALFSYSTLAPAGSDVASVHIPFSGTSDETWTWDPKANAWDLSYSGTPATVASGAQITATNVVVQTVQTSTGPWLENDLGAYEVEVNPTSGGTVTVLRNGKAITGTWERPSINAPMRLVAANGSTIPLQPGNTWIEMVPSSIDVTTAPGATTSPSATTASSG